MHTHKIDDALVDWIEFLLPKVNRGQQEIVLILGGYEPYSVPDRVMREIYETGYTQLPKAIRNYRV